MKKLLSHLLTPIFLLVFGFWLLLFHPIQYLCLKIGGRYAHDYSVAVLNFLLIHTGKILGTSYKLEGAENLISHRPLLIVTNHQSMYDVPPFFWTLRALHPKFVTKKELGKGIPSISFNLKYGGSVLIDRKDGKQAITEIHKLADYVNSQGFTAVIFPEGTRSRNGELKPFKTAGLISLMEKMPEALIVPITINNSYKMLPYGKYPLGLGVQVSHTIHPAIENKGDHKELAAKIEAVIASKLEKPVQ